MCVCLLCVIVSLIVLGVCIFACFLLSIDRGLFNFFFFFNKKKAYERRISDWSSDVCSSDRLVSTTPADGATGFPAAGDLEVVFNEVVDAAAGAFALACDVSGGVALSHPASGAAFTLSTNTALHGGEHCVLSIDAAKLTDAGGAHPGTNASVGFNVAEGGGGDDDDGYYAHVNASSPRSEEHTSELQSQMRISYHAFC